MKKVFKESDNPVDRIQGNPYGPLRPKGIGSRKKMKEEEGKKKKKGKKHDCATHVEHVEFGQGQPIHGQHAEPDENGNIAWYDVMFEHGVEKNMSTDDLTILMSEVHENHDHGDEAIQETRMVQHGDGAYVSKTDGEKVKTVTFDKSKAKRFSKSTAKRIANTPRFRLDFQPDGSAKKTPIKGTKSGRVVREEELELDEAVDQKQLLAMYKKLKKGDKIDVTFDSSIRRGKDPMTLIVTSPHRTVGKAKVGRIIFKNVDNMGGIKYFWYNRNDKISMAQGDMAVSPREVKMSTNEGFASDAQRRAAFASGYKAKGKKGKKEETELDEASPKGFEGTVKAMKKYKDIDNPYALAHHMKKMGYKSHKNPDGTDIQEKNVPTNPSLWSKMKSQAKAKFDVYPSAYANAWAAKKYKAAGGSWRKG
tara:strand:- start:2097 stop:3359 length:1263 start_codon:yes stop_codon:yes gene_type:complete